MLPGAKTGDPIFRNEYLLKREPGGQNIRGRIIRSTIMWNRPFPIPKYKDESEKMIMSAIEFNHYDYILVRYILNTWTLFKLNEEDKKRTIVDFDDVLSGSLYESKIRSASGLLRKIRLRLNRRFLVKYEKKCLKFAASLFCSEKDKALFVNGNKSNASVIPNIYHNKSFDNYDFGDGFMNRHRLLFVGGLMYKPNIEGVRWFVEKIFPDFRKKYPEAKLLLVGHSPAPEIKELSERVDGVELYADVPDIREYYRQSSLLVVPLLGGGGTRIKILEASLANRPVLSTPIGAEGLDLIDERDLLLFENGEEFIAQYGKLQSRQMYQSLIKNARDIVSMKYSPQRFYHDMEKVLNQIRT
jgi:glycosyltransferase involved in cell wall biosynthesis